MTRRKFLFRTTQAAASLSLPVLLPTVALPPPQKKIAAIVTEYRQNSHADVIVTRFLQGYQLGSELLMPQVRIASLYADQFPGNDLARPRTQQAKVALFATIPEALTLGSGALAVDGILLIAEHGQYPRNERGQKLYPKRELFEEVVNVFRRTGKSVPVFCDKHLSHRWEDAKWMVDQAEQLKFPIMAGSSLPVAWRVPAYEVPLNSKIHEALAIGYGGLEDYGFHALEVLQCMVERRRGGETGVRSVQCLEGEAVWKAADEQRWSSDLMNAALERIEKKSLGNPRRSAVNAAAFLIQYEDGLTATILMLPGFVEEFGFAAKVEGQLVSTLFRLGGETSFYGHFSYLVHNIQKMFLAGTPTYPVERTLLTTGLLSRAMDSRHEGRRQLATPELKILYKPGNWSWERRA